MEMLAIKQRKPSAGETLKLGLGALLFFGGILMMLTIILFLPGLSAFLVGFLLMYFGRPKETIECRSCSGDVTARLGEKQAKCEHCDTIQPIKWTKS